PTPSTRRQTITRHCVSGAKVGPSPTSSARSPQSASFWEGWTADMNTFGYPSDVFESMTADAEDIISRYPEARSALLPMLHLVQSIDGYVSPNGIAFCAHMLDLSRANVSAVATFYSQYK